MNGRARTANALPIGLLLLALGVPGVCAADAPQAAAAAAAKKPKADVTPQVTPADATQAPETPPQTSPGVTILPEPPTSPASFKPDPPYPAYDAKDELAIYMGKHLNETANPPVDLGLGLYDRGAYAPRPTLLGRENPVQFYFMAYGDLRTAVADNDNGKPAANGKTYQSQVATRLNLDLDLNLTPTERIHAFMRPFDKLTTFTRYDLDGAVRDKFVPEFNTKLITLFFEGDLGNILMGIRGKPSSFDIPIAGGLVPIFTQNGIWIQDAFKGAAIGITAKHSKDLDISNMDLTFFTGQAGVTSDAFGVGHGSGKIYALAGFADLLKGYMEAGYGYVEADDKDLSYHNVTAAFTTRFEGTVSNSVRLIANFGQKAAVKTANGLLVLVENSLITSRRAVVAISRLRVAAYEMHINRTCAPDRGSGQRERDRAQSHAGQQMFTRLVFEHLGGMLQRNFLISPRVTASRCSAMTSWCQLTFTGEGSKCGQASAKKSISDPSSLFRSILRPCSRQSTSSSRR